MFKKFLLLALVTVVGLWIAGYDLERISNLVSGAGESSAGQMSGRSTLDDGGWGD